MHNAISMLSNLNAYFQLVVTICFRMTLCQASHGKCHCGRSTGAGTIDGSHSFLVCDELLQ